MTNSVVFIDPRVHDYQTLVDGAEPGQLVFLLDLSADGISQIADILVANGLTGLNAISIVAHGVAGELQLGSAPLDESDLNDLAEPLATIGAALSDDGDILLYACDVAEGENGQTFIADLARLTGGDIAAASHPVGSTTLGSSWILDATTGSIEAANPFSAETLADFQGVLAAPVTISPKPETDRQFRPQLAPLGDGFSVVGWNDLKYSTFRTDAQFRIVGADGTPVSLTTTLPDNGSDEFIGAFLPMGATVNGFKFAVIYEKWTEGGAPNFVTNAAILGTFYEFNTTTMAVTAGADFVVSDSPVSDNQYPVATMVDPNHFAVAWAYDPDSWAPGGTFDTGEVIRLFDVNGTPTTAITPIRNTADGISVSRWGSISSDGTNVVVQWEEGTGHLFLNNVTTNGAGGIVTIPAPVEVSIAGATLWSSIAMPSGDIMQLYSANGGDDLFFRLVSGTAPFSETRPPQQVNSIISEFGADSAVAVVLPSGGFVISWTRPDSANDVKLYARIFDENFTARTNDILVANDTAYDRIFTPNIQRGPDGGVYIVWEYDGTNEGTGTSSGDDNPDIIGRLFVNIGPTATGTPETLTSFAEDTTNPDGTVLSSFLTDQYDDLDNHPLAGVAVRGNAATGDHGTWQYSTNGGGNWTDIPTNVSDSNATILAPAALVRFVPATNFNGNVPALSVRLWDGQGAFSTGTTGINITGAIFDSNPNGGTLENPFTGNTIAVGQFVTGVNDAPSATGSGSLGSINEDISNPAGQTVASFVTGSFSDSLDNQTANGGTSADTLAGIAIVANSTTSEGTWQYSTNGSTWSDVGTPSFTSALVIQSTHFLRFVPTSDFHGSAPTLTAHVIDSSGASGAITTGSVRSLSGATGGVTAISTTSLSIGETINPVNDPVTSSAGTAALDEDSSVSIPGLSIADVDTVLDPAGVYEVTLSATNGAQTLTTLAGLTFTVGDGLSDTSMTFHGTLANINTALASASYTPTADYNGSATVTINVTDTFGGIVATGSGAATNDSDVVNITVNAVNDPVSVSAPAVAIVAEDATNSAVSGLAISDVDATLAPNGVYEVTLSSTNGGLTLTSIAGLAFTSGDGTSDATMTFSGTLAAINTALATTKYTPTPDYNGPATITIGATDIFGGGVATGSGSATSASDVVDLTVNAVNDAPTVSGDGTEDTSAIFEDQPSAAGQTVSSLVGSQFSDQLDDRSAFTGGSSPNSLAGIAVVTDGSSADGDWQWLNGAVWTNIGTASTAAAKLFAAGTAIRFNPVLNFNGAAPTLATHLIDDSGAAVTDGATVDLSGLNAIGGATRYSTATVTLSQGVTAVNDAPDPFGDSASVLSFGSVSSPPNVLTNDTDVDSLAASLEVVSVSSAFSGAGTVGTALAGQYGTLTLQSDGSFTYAADNAAAVLADDVVQDLFTYEIDDDQNALSNAATITVSITGRSIGTPDPDAISGNGSNNSLSGLGSADTLTGGAGDDTLDGGAGNDYLQGGAGVDSYFELSGNDTLAFSDSTGAVTANLANGSIAADGFGNVESVTLGDFENLIGSAQGDTLTGDALDNVIFGNAGADTLAGGGGNDIFFLDNPGDEVDEVSAPGYDRVVASVDYTIVDPDIEQLQITGTALTAKGNASANTIFGNANANLINGDAGNDTMFGGVGDDIYLVQDGGDAVLEDADAGLDRVIVTVDYTMADPDLEYLQLAGAAISGTGNGSSNVIFDNALDNTLTGGAGNDTYFVQNTGDVVVEALGAAGGSSDFVRSSATFTLPANVEHLVLTGAAVDGAGNSQGNLISGNGAANRLAGKAGNDALIGGLGGDTFVFDTALNATTNVDTITDFLVGTDTIELASAIFAGLAPGALPAGAFNTGAAASEPDDRIVYNPANGALIFDLDGNTTPGGATRFATLSTGLNTLSAADFMVA